MRINDQRGSETPVTELDELPLDPIPEGDLDDQGRAQDPVEPQDNNNQNNDVLPEFDDDGRPIQYVDENNKPIPYAELMQPGEQYDDVPAPVQQQPRREPEPELPPYIPPKPTFMTAEMEAEERERLATLMLTDPVAAMDAHATFLEKQRNQADNITRWRRGEIDRKYPNFAREHYVAIEQGLQMLPPAQRAEDSAELFAVFQAIGTEVMQHPKKDLLAVLKRNIALMEGEKAQQQSAARPAPVTLTRAQRNTPSSTTVAGMRAPAAIRGSSQRSRSNLSPAAQALKDSGLHDGLSDSEYERAAGAMAVGGRR